MPIPIDRLIRSRRRSLALIVEPNGSLTVRAPLRTPEKQIRAFVESKASMGRAEAGRGAGEICPGEAIRRRGSLSISG